MANLHDADREVARAVFELLRTTIERDRALLSIQVVIHEVGKSTSVHDREMENLELIVRDLLLNGGGHGFVASKCSELRRVFRSFGYDPHSPDPFADGEE
jgi:hypothetical protein